MGADADPVGELCTCGGLIAWRERESGWDGSCMGACGRYLSVDSTVGPTIDGIVLNAAVAAMDGCPWVDKGHVVQVADGIAETVADRIGQVDSFLLPDGQPYAAGSCADSKRAQACGGEGYVRYYEAAYYEAGSIRTLNNGTPCLATATTSVEVFNSPNPRKPHPDRVYFVAFQDRPDWRPLPAEERHA